MSYNDVGPTITGEPTKTSWANGVRSNQEYFNSLLKMTEYSCRPNLEYLDSDTIMISPGNRSGISIDSTNTSLEEFDSVSGWSYDNGSGSINLDSANQISGSAMLTYDKTSTSDSIVRIKKSGYSIDLSKCKFIRIYTDIDESDVSKISHHRLYLSSNSSLLSDYYRYDLDVACDLRGGGVYILLDPSSYHSTNGSPDLSDIKQIYLETETNDATDTLSAIGFDQFIKIDYLSIKLSENIDTTTENSDKFYYIYAQDSSTAYFSGLAPIETRRGLHPWNDHAYLGCIYNDSSSNILPFKQINSIFLYREEHQEYSSSSIVDESWTDLNISYIPPKFLGKFYSLINVDSSGGDIRVQWDFSMGDSISKLYSLDIAGDDNGGGSLYMELKITPSPSKIRHTINFTGSGDPPNSATRELYAVGWIDPFLT